MAERICQLADNRPIIPPIRDVTGDGRLMGRVRFPERGS
jgi:hypothetical protein